MLSLAVFDLVYLVVSLLIFTAPAFSTSFAHRFSPYIMPLALPMAQLSMTGNQELKHTHTDFFAKENVIQDLLHSKVANSVYRPLLGRVKKWVINLEFWLLLPTSCWDGT